MIKSSAPTVAVVGAGLTGLTAAWRLQVAGFNVRVFERGLKVGGRTQSIRKDGFVFDTGAITMLPTYAKTCALVEELGISAHLHQVTPVIGIPRDGQIHRIDLAHPIKSLLGTKLISWGAKLRLLKLLPFMIRTWNRSDYQSLSSLAQWDQETIAQFAKRELGEELHEYVVGPIIRGNTLNSTDFAPAGELFWMLRQYAAPFLFGFDQGINFLAESLAAKLPIEFETEVTQVHPEADSVSIHGRSSGGDFKQVFDACVLALPPPALQVLAPELTVRQRNFFDSITPLVSISVHVGLRGVPAATETFILPPKTEHAILTTIVMDHLKAPGRAPAGTAVLSFFVSDDWGSQNLNRCDADLMSEILRMAEPFIGDIRSDIETYVVQRWPYAIIKSRVGLYRKMGEFEADLVPDARVQLAGDFMSLGMEAAVSSGSFAASRLCERFGKPIAVVN